MDLAQWSKSLAETGEGQQILQEKGDVCASLKELMEICQAEEKDRPSRYR